jgi:hypothetical protein
LLLPPVALGGSVRGDYVEARTADVYTGYCVANGEMNLAGKEAIMAWRVTDGEWKGADLTGLSVLAVVSANSTLGDSYSDPLPARAVLVVDERADAGQKRALVDMAQALGGQLLGEVVKIESEKIDFETGGHGEAKVKAGDVASLVTRCLAATDHLCGNEEVYYPPLTPVAQAHPAFTLVNEFNGDGLNMTWNNSFKRSAFVGSFQR